MKKQPRKAIFACTAHDAVARFPRLLGGGLCALALSACSVLSPSATPQPAFYALNGVPGAAGAANGSGVAANASSASLRISGQPTLIINPPRAAAGFDSQRIIYLREAHKLEYFANSEWVDPPARMLGTLLVASLQDTGAFRAVVLAPGTAVGEMRLETDIIRLQQEFQTSPSRVRFTLRATLLDDKTRRVLAWREFDASVTSPTDDPYGGVVAANGAVQWVLKDLAEFCAEQGRRP
jgi:cholesterol transport system auxiliary component